MTEKKFFDISFFAPIVVPIFAFLVMFLFTSLDSFLDFIAFFLAFSLIYGGIPYIVFLVAYYFWQKNKNGKQIKYFTLAAPFIFTAIFLLILCMYNVLFQNIDFYQFLKSEVLFYARISLLTSFGYVLIVHFIYYVLCSFKKIET